MEGCVKTVLVTSPGKEQTRLCLRHGLSLQSNHANKVEAPCSTNRDEPSNGTWFANPLPIPFSVEIPMPEAAIRCKEPAAEILRILRNPW